MKYDSYLHICKQVLKWREKSNNKDLKKVARNLVKLGKEINRLEMDLPLELGTSVEHEVNKKNLRNDIKKCLKY